MRLARVVLDLGMTHSAFYNLRKDAWLAHKECVRRAWASRVEYRARIGRAVALARQLNADVLLLPACALVGRLGAWTPLFEGVPITVAGTLRIVRGRPVRYVERAVVLRGSRMELVFGCADVQRVHGPKRHVYAAVSSTIGGMVRGHRTGDALVLDAGHHAYNGRYRKVLRRVAGEAAGPHGRSLAALAFWRPQPSRGSFAWIEAVATPFTWSRLPLAHRRGVDLLDIIDIAGV